ncbi:unnamed protein product [Protopolystoma xenopodis]|uniref:Uncharacterized protein n=1 Tax=Protopolystoma xenopodis TaxID=117903 RepID=A0A448XI26_9PLAT|nr:unnamed protein product [Protopolystoma xenopodis]
MLLPRSPSMFEPASRPQPGLASPNQLTRDSKSQPNERTAGYVVCTTSGYSVLGPDLQRWLAVNSLYRWLASGSPSPPAVVKATTPTCRHTVAVDRQKLSRRTTHVDDSGGQTERSVCDTRRTGTLLQPPNPRRTASPQPLPVRPPDALGDGTGHRRGSREADHMAPDDPSSSPPSQPVLEQPPRRLTRLLLRLLNTQRIII